LEKERSILDLDGEAEEYLEIGGEGEEFLRLRWRFRGVV
jgi:hypothetical protein